MHIQKNVVAFVNGLHHGRAKGNVIDKVTIHDIQMHPVGTGTDRARRFLADASEIGGKQRRSDDAILVGERDHGFCWMGIPDSMGNISQSAGAFFDAIIVV